MKHWYAYYAAVVSLAFIFNLINSGTWLTFLLAPLLLTIALGLVVVAFLSAAFTIAAIADKF